MDLKVLFQFQFKTCKRNSLLEKPYSLTHLNKKMYIYASSTI